MALDRYTTLGRSGLRVSPLALGTMTFGDDWGWGADERNSRRMFDAYLAAGGNFIDTANLYTGGHSEVLVGKFVADAGVRDKVVIATKYSYNTAAGNPNADERSNLTSGWAGCLHLRPRRDTTDTSDSETAPSGAV